MGFKNSQTGFSAVEAILLLVVVGIIGGTGWFVWHSKQAADKTLNQTGKSTTTQTSKAAGKDEAGPVGASGTKELTIKEWNVQVSYTSSDTLLYRLATDGGPAEIISSNLATKYGCTESGAGLITRQTASDYSDATLTTTVAQTYAKNPSLYTKIGSYYYGYNHDQAACGTITMAQPGASASAGEQAQSSANSFTQSLLPKLKAVTQ